MRRRDENGLLEPNQSTTKKTLMVLGLLVAVLVVGVMVALAGWYLFLFTEGVLS